MMGKTDMSDNFIEIKDISFQLVSVNNFKDVLNYLNNMEVNNA